MPFRTGTVSYARFRLDGAAVPTEVSQEHLETLRAGVVAPATVGAPPEIQAGWCAGRHVFDTDFDPEVVAFGSTLLFGMRVDTARVPLEIRRAYRAMAEAAQSDAAAAAVPSRGRRDAARLEADEQCRRDLAEGRHRRSRMVPVLWDLPRRLVLAPVFGETLRTALADLFHASFDAVLAPLTSGALAHACPTGRAATRNLDDAHPTAFTPPPPAVTAEAGRDPRVPVVPWAWADGAARDFLGNELLLWLWWRSVSDGGVIETPAGVTAFVIDQVLDLECAWDVTGRQALRADGPSRLPEAHSGLRSGKWPRRAGLVVESGGEQWSLVLQGDRFHVSSARLPKPEEEQPGGPREETERRLESILALDAALGGLFESFLRARLDASWPVTAERIGAWIRDAGRPRRGAAALKVDLPVGT